MTPMTALFQEYEFTMYCNLYVDMSLIQQVQFRVILNLHNFNNEKTPRDKPHFVLQKSQKRPLFLSKFCKVRVLFSDTSSQRHSKPFANDAPVSPLRYLYSHYPGTPLIIFLERPQNRDTPLFFLNFLAQFSDFFNIAPLETMHKLFLLYKTYISIPCDTLICFFSRSY